MDSYSFHFVLKYVAIHQAFQMLQTHQIFLLFDLMLFYCLQHAQLHHQRIVQIDMGKVDKVFNDRINYVRVCAREIRHHRSISGSIHRSLANRLDKLCLLSLSTDANRERILFEDSSSGGAGALDRLGFTTNTIINPMTTSANRIIALRLVVRRW